MKLTPKIKYQLFLYNYFLQYIKENLYNDYYNVNNKNKCIEEIPFLTNEINELQEINNNENIKYKKSRGKHRKHLYFLSNIRKKVLNIKKNKLTQNIKFIIEFEEHKNKFRYKDYDDYFHKHVNYYKFSQKIKCDIKKKYDSIIENIYKNIYNPINILQLLKNDTEIDDVFIILDKKIQDIMYNIF